MIDSYLALNTALMVGVILFLGNIIVTGWWKAAADRTNDAAIVAFAQGQVVATDWVFTLGGAVLLTAAGSLAAAVVHGMDIESSTWLKWGFAIFTLSGLIWVVVLIPCQAAQNRMAREFVSGEAIPERYWRLNCIWYAFIATILPMGAVRLMVAKPV